MSHWIGMTLLLDFSRLRVERSGQFTIQGYPGRELGRPRRGPGMFSELIGWLSEAEQRRSKG
jgi:hypothetical protein